MLLIDHINKEHDGNITAFARYLGVARQQIQRWIKLNCIWYQGKVWQPKTEILKL